jgi:hydrogenase maturation factor HypF (carbamoyltransferase family)
MGSARPGGAGREDAHDALDPSIAIGVIRRLQKDHPQISQITQIFLTNRDWKNLRNLRMILLQSADTSLPRSAVSADMARCKKNVLDD